eukprot:TRINITY_DN3485_c0_g4_i1.p1 TRINITY_DN3485_c0_g4~~TRINITY_DN3485_c0_g4_i1.p1  ORF type:complete len:428 (-),score=106.36 TRINITY_DN3485_c0_g4_i1:37-1320(-)
MLIRNQIALNKITQKSRKRNCVQRRRKTDFFEHLQMGPPDAILGLTVAFNNDTFDKKINVGVGAYRDDSGKPYVLDCVRKAEKIIYESKMNHEYSGISGDAKFTSVAAKLLFGEDADVLKEGLVHSSQSISGTGALRIAGNFLRRHLPNDTIYVPNPTWGNHIPLFKDAGFNVEKYKYYDGKTGLDFQGFRDSIANLPNNSIVLFHACAHNPTGIDPKREQWEELSSICLDKEHFVFFDSAYQGFASGDVDGDAFAVRKFVEDGHRPMVAQSFAKNFGLYGERVGCLHLLGNTPEETKILDSQMKIVIRPTYSNPPIHGARIVSTILNDKELKAQWFEEVKMMADRIIEMRNALKSKLVEAGSTKNWDHITEQIGMFCFSGMTPEQVDRLREEFHIYMTKDGRISMAGVTSGNVDYLAESIHAVTKQ